MAGYNNKVEITSAIAGLVDVTYIIPELGENFLQCLCIMTSPNPRMAQYYTKLSIIRISSPNSGITWFLHSLNITSSNSRTTDYCTSSTIIDYNIPQCQNEKSFYQVST